MFDTIKVTFFNCFIAIIPVKKINKTNQDDRTRQEEILVIYLMGLF